MLAVNVVETTNWVKEDTYHVIIDNFDYMPRLKINIVDPVQSIVPLVYRRIKLYRIEGRKLLVPLHS